MSSESLTNPALADLHFLVGDWDVEISKASFLPDPDQVVDAGSVSFRPIEGGAYLVQRHAEGVGPPAATWVIGRDGSRDLYTVLYADGRGVARVYEMAFSGHTWKLWRDDPEFSQRFEATVGADHNQIAGRWEKRFARAEWEHDFNLRYSRRR